MPNDPPIRAPQADREQPLRSSEERFRLLVESVEDYAIFMLDPAGIVQTWNIGAQRIKYYQASEIIGRHFSAFYRPEDRWKCARELEVATKEGRVEDEGWRVRKDGTLFWALVVITALREPDGRLVGFAKVTRDMTERRMAEETLRQSEERFRLLVESVKDYAIFLLDPTGHVATWNAGAERIKGYRAEQIIGQHFSKFYPEEDIRAGKCEMELDVAARDGRFEDEGWRLRSDGQRFWANVVITGLRNGSGELVGFAKVTRDLTERKRAEEERLRAGSVARGRVNMLAQLAERLASTTSVAEVGQAVVTEGIAFAGADTCALYVLDERTKTLALLAERGCNPEILAGLRKLTNASGPPAHRVGTGESGALWVETAEQYAAQLPEVAALPAQGRRVQAFWCVPVSAEGGVIGMLGVGFHEPRTFPSDEREFVATFARQCGQALARARRLENERATATLAERLRSSLATTLRSIADAVIATDASGRVTFMNAVAESLSGWPEDEARGRPLAEVFRIIDPETRAVVPDPVEKVLATAAPSGSSHQRVLVERNGRETFIEDSTAPIRRDNGEVDGVVLVFRDVTARRAREAQATFLSDATAVLAESLDYETTVARVSSLSVPRVADWCAIDLVVPGSAIPRRLAVAHVDPAKIELAHELHAKYPPQPGAGSGTLHVLRTGRPELHADITDAQIAAACVDEEHLRAALELGLRSAMIVPLVAQGRVLGAMTFVHAESGRRYTPADLAFAEELGRRCAIAIENARLFGSEQEARKAADVANRAKDEFLAVVSHELRTPLNAIMGWSKLLMSQEFDEARRRKANETIERNAVAMAQLIEDLLDMSRVISGKLRLEVQPVDAVSVVEAAIESLQPAAAAKQIRLAPVLDTTVPSLVGDPTRLQQIVWNLLSNAVKFTPKGGRVSVIVHRVDSSIQIVVSDTGKGIDPGFLPSVFEPFRQEDASTTRARGGLGLGLAISRQLVELHGGTIRAESAGEGRGATFTVSLPISAVGSARSSRPEHTEHQVAQAAYEKPLQLRGIRILAVDDEEDARRLVSAILEDCGCIVSLAASVSDAMTKIAEEMPDLLLSDIGMPDEDGYELIRRVRALPRDRGGDLPAAALTAYARAEDRRRLLNAGFSMHLAKPIEPAELVAVVATLTRFIERPDAPAS
ncbi:MAG: two-component hybrid sensor and regulator [Labilithrix sp.]|nr:two-component hybrid sensor and regulator [Labilithrix sp.]